MTSQFLEFKKLLESFPNYLKTFRYYDYKEIKEFEIAGQDFIFDMCAVVDIMNPIVNLLLELQNLQTPIWKLSIWQKKILEELEKFKDFSVDNIDSGMCNLFSNVEDIKQMKYKNTNLVPGWLIVGESPSEDNDDEKKSQMESQRDL